MKIKDIGSVDGTPNFPFRQIEREVFLQVFADWADRQVMETRQRVVSLDASRRHGT